MSSRMDNQRPVEKAQDTAKWARIMTKWLIKYSKPKGARWNVVDFGGKTGAEARGIIDLMAIRKDHRHDARGLKRGDLLEIIIIQVKGGSALRPTDEDIGRLLRVAKYHRAKGVVLAEWKKGKTPDLSILRGREWKEVKPRGVFG